MVRKIEICARRNEMNCLYYESHEWPPAVECRESHSFHSCDSWSANRSLAHSRQDSNHSLIPTCAINTDRRFFAERILGGFDVGAITVPCPICVLAIWREPLIAARSSCPGDSLRLQPTAALGHPWSLVPRQPFANGADAVAIRATNQRLAGKAGLPRFCSFHQVWGRLSLGGHSVRLPRRFAGWQLRPVGYLLRRR